MGATIAARFGAEPREPIAPPTIDEIELRAPRIEPPASLAHLCTDRPVRTRGPHVRQVVPRHLARAAPRLLATARPRRHPARRGRCRRRCSTGAATRGVAAIPYGGGSSVVGGVECDVDDDYRGAVSDRHARARPGARDRSHVACGAHPSRRLRPRARRPTAPARPHAAPLPPIVRVLDARRMARDAIGRALRDAAHAHRRLRRVDPRGHAPRRLGEPAPSRFGRGTVARPHAARLGRHPRRHHRSVDAAAGPPDVPRRRPPRASPTSRRRGRGGARRSAQSRPVSRELPPARSGRSRSSPAPTTAGDTILLLAFESADHPLDAWIARAVECARDHGGRVDDAIVIRAEGKARAKASAGNWRNAFVRAPYTRDALVGARHHQRDVRDRVHLGPVRRAARRRDASRCSTPRSRRRVAGGRHVPLHARVSRRSRAVLHRARARHASPNSSRSGRRSRPRPATAIGRFGGTITHHHAVGRDHRPLVRRGSARNRSRLRCAPRRRRSIPARCPQSRRADRPMSYQAGHLRPGRRRLPVAVRGVRRVRPRQRPRTRARCAR